MDACIVPAEWWHVDTIAASARPADALELWAIARATPRDCMENGIAAAPAFTGLLDGVPVCMFGVVPDEPGAGVPWMVGSTRLCRLAAQKALLHRSREWIAQVRGQFAVLFNVVDDRNVAAKRWLRWLGFTVSRPAPMGQDGEAFCTFYWRRS